MTPRLRQVLVVDDDVVILRLVREALMSLMKCVVETTPNPEYAFEMVLKKQFDLFIFDFSMPGIDGAVLYGLISKLYALKPPHAGRMPPLILMTGHASQKRAQELLQRIVDRRYRRRSSPLAFCAGCCWS